MRRTLPILLALLLTVALAGAAWWWLGQARLTEEEVRQTVVTTVERETPQSFLVVGALDATASVGVTSTRRVPLFDLSLGETSTRVRVPGRIAYGFDVRALRPESVHLRGDTVTVTLPPLEILSAEPDLARMEVQTDRGWLRSSDSEQRVEQRAVGLLTRALRAQGEAHLSGESVQPLDNAARAMEAMLRPAFAAAGHDDLHYRFQLTPTLVRESR
jgi:hypothetical protein